MVMHQYDGRSCNDDCGTEHLTGMNKDSVHRAHGHELVAFHSSARVKEENHKALTFRIEMGNAGDVQTPIIRCAFWRVTYLHLLGCRALAQRNHFVFLRFMICGTFFLRSDIEDEITSLLRLRCRVNDKFSVVLQSLQPILNVTS